MHQKGDFDACGFSGHEDFMPVHIRSDQTVTFHNNPLICIIGPVFLYPVHFPASIAIWRPAYRRIVLQSVREPQDLLLLRRGKTPDPIQDGFFETHDMYLLIIPNIRQRGVRALCWNQGALALVVPAVYL
jgi:hypothetical protein